MMSVVTVEKPISKVALSDWYGKVAELQQTCDNSRSDAFQLRNEAKKARSEADCKTQWDTYHNNMLLTDRITEVTRWRELIHSCLRAVEKETSDLKMEKEITETEAENLNMHFTLVNECLSMRDVRGSADLCQDDVESELKRELSTLESLKKMLTDNGQAAWEQMNRLDEVRFQLLQDLLDKDKLLEICKSNFAIDKDCASISYKSEPLQMPKKLISYNSWLEGCKYLKQRAENELTTAQKLRETMCVPREKAKNDLKAQNDATNFAQRKRIYETRRLKNELEWQRYTLLPEMDRLMKEITHLEAALDDKTNALKLAESRCEKQLYRTGAGMCLDDPMLGMKDEVLQLRRTNRDLLGKIDAAKATYNHLEDKLMVVERELGNKSQALTMEERCLDLRTRLNNAQAGPASKTDRNVILTRMQDEISPEF